MLGSSRSMVQSGQTSLCYDADFTPFGTERVVNASCSSSYKFEGKERDTETNNDDFGARYYSYRFGRWLSADWSSVPAPVPYANLSNPQTLNLYAMVSDNPETFADLDGHFWNPFGWFAALLDKSQQPSTTTNDSNAASGQAPTQNKPQYDPKKSGPEDPTNPGHPLSQNPVVKKASDEAFMKTTNGQARSGLAEAGFAIDYKDGKISIVNKVDSVNSDKKANELQITTDENTKAILHTHGNSALPTPSPGDLKSPVPNFVRSQRDLYVTVPGTTTYIRLQ
jgi:RHS repeat-associated protein